MLHSGEQVLDLGERGGGGSDTGFGQQDRLFGKHADLSDGGPEDPAERVGCSQVVTVDADPGNVSSAGPPRLNGTSALAVLVDRPQPGDVIRALLPKQRDDVTPGRHECARRNMVIAPLIPGAVHLVPEPDDHGVSEAAHAVGI